MAGGELDVHVRMLILQQPSTCAFCVAMLRTGGSARGYGLGGSATTVVLVTRACMRWPQAGSDVEQRDVVATVSTHSGSMVLAVAGRGGLQPLPDRS